jgi:hypothetical protein
MVGRGRVGGGGQIKAFLKLKKDRKGGKHYPIKALLKHYQIKAFLKLKKKKKKKIGTGGSIIQ